MADYSAFASPDFDPGDYANTILATGPKSSAGDLPPKQDASVAISRLTSGIDDVSKQIKQLVTTHHEPLLSQASSVSDIKSPLASVKQGLTELDSSLDKLRVKIHTPYHTLQTHVLRMQKLSQASDVLRRTARFVVLARRLQAQMTEIKSGVVTTDKEETIASASLSHIPLEDDKERTIAKAALSIAELVTLLDAPPSIFIDGNIGDKDAAQPISLRSVHVVAAHIPFIEDSRQRVTNDMQDMILTGLSVLDQSLLASSLQTAYNLRVLPELVQSLVSDLSQAVEERIKGTFDLSQISKDAAGKDDPNLSPTQSRTSYKSRVRTEPTNVTVPQWTAALWIRLEKMVEEMAGCCIKVYTLEKVLRLKRDTMTQAVFLDEAMQTLENKPSATFWTALSRSLEQHARDSLRSSSFLQQTLSTGYPRFLRLFHEFFAKIAVHTDAVYSEAYQSPETVLVLRALSKFEAAYLSRSSSKLNETVAQAFARGAKTPPGHNDGLNIARNIINELDSARFDPLLVRAVAKGAASCLDLLISRANAQITRDRLAITLAGPTATSQQIANAQVATCIYHCWVQLDKLKNDHVEAVVNIMKPQLQALHGEFKSVIDNLMTSIRRDLGSTIARLHRIDFSKPVDSSGMGGSSLYIKDLVDKLNYIKTEILAKFNIGDAGEDWILSILKFVAKTFVLHASIAKPLSESGKLRLTNDMTELEFALSAFGGNLETAGVDYKALRAMRPLLFLDNAQLSSSKHTSGLPTLVVLHHILVRSPLPLPHTLHGWQEAEYVRWIDEHSEEEAWSLVEGGMTHWEKTKEPEGEEYSEGQEYIKLARTVLPSNAR